MDARSTRQRAVAVSDPSGVGEARRQIAALGTAVALDPARAGDLALAVTEAATNIVKHAHVGTIIGRILAHGSLLGIEVLALDKGSGMSSVSASMRDGHSTSGSPGQGLGALNRITSAMEIWSSPGGGTIMRFEIWPKSDTTRNGFPQTGVVCVEKTGETACGDGWAVVEDGDRVVVFVGDGLGHGPDAAAAVQAAISAVQRHPELDAKNIMEMVHDALRATRGAAGAVAILSLQRQQCDFCGVGNISAMVRSDGKGHSIVSNNGTLGHHIRRLQPYQYAFPRNALFIAHSDGIGTHWDLAAYPGLEGRHASIVAAALFRDHNRGRDDSTILALRNSARSPA